MKFWKLAFCFLLLAAFSPWDVGGSWFSPSTAYNNLVKKPITWVKDTVKTQLSSFRFQEFKKCLADDASKFRIQKLVVPEDEAFQDLNNAWNLRIIGKKEPVDPAAILVPTSARDVSTAVICGKKASQPLVPNSGGLSFESISWGKPDSVVLDFRQMNKIRIEQTSTGPVVAVEPGALVGHIDSYLWKNGGYGLPMSHHLTAGLAGNAIGGSQGPFSALYGLTVDNILNFELIDSFGTKHEVGPNNPPDLWWAVRGMGPGLVGLITELKLKIIKAADLKLTFVTVRYPLKKFVEAFEAFQKFHTWSEENNPTSSRTLFITSDSYNKQYPALLKGITIQLLHIQDPVLQPKSDEDFLTTVKSTFAETNDITTTNPNYFEFVSTTGYAPIEYPRLIDGKPSYMLKKKLIKGEMPTEEELHSYMKLMTKENAAKRFLKLKSMFVNRLLTNAELLKLKDEIVNMAPHILVQVTTETGAIRSHARNENSYVHRNATFNVSYRYEGTVKKEGRLKGVHWVRQFRNSTKFWDSGESYQNFEDLDYDKLELVGRNYKQNKGKLVDTKRKWDPEEYFKTDVSLPIFLH